VGIRENMFQWRASRARGVAVLAVAALALAWNPAQSASLSVPSFDISQNPLFKFWVVRPKVDWINDDEFIAVWMQLSPGSTEEDGRWDVMMRRFNAAGIPLTDAIRIANAHQTWSLDDVVVRAVSEQHFVVVWPESDTRTGAGFDLYGQVFTTEGSAASLRFAINKTFDDHQAFPSILPLRDDRFMVVWRSSDAMSDGSDIYAQRFRMDGTRLGTEVRINSVTTGDQSRPWGDCDSRGRCLVAWHSAEALDGSTSVRVQGQYLNHNAVFIGTEFTIAPAEVSSVPLGSLFPLVAMDGDGNATVSWADGNPLQVLRFRRYRPDGSIRNDTRSLSTSPGSFAYPVADANGSYGLAWSDTVVDGRSRVLFRDYGVTGPAISTIVIANVPTADARLRVSGAAVSPAGKVAVVWHEFPSDSQVFDSWLRGAVLEGFGLAPDSAESSSSSSAFGESRTASTAGTLLERHEP
jgi:hypothetical protein